MGYFGNFGPGRQSLTIAAAVTSMQLALLLFWANGPNTFRILAILFNVPVFLSIGFYLVALPLLIFGLVRASTAIRLGIERRAGMAGALGNLIGIAVWLYPLLKSMWQR